MTTVALTVICVALVVTLIVQQRLHNAVVRELCDRIQAPEIAPLSIPPTREPFTPTVVDDDEAATREEA